MSKLRLAYPPALAGFFLLLLLFALKSSTSQAYPSKLPVDTPAIDAKNQTSGNPLEQGGGIITSPVKISIDDFAPQPYQGETVYFYNRLEGDRGGLNDAELIWGGGLVTATIAPGNDWAGIWFSLNHPIAENQAVDFSAVLPDPILTSHQSSITKLEVKIKNGTPNTNLKLELKDGTQLRWVSPGTELTGGEQTLIFDLPPLGNITQLVVVIDQAAAGDFVVVEDLSFEATTQITDTAEAAFVWSYGMLLNNWDPETGLVRDNAKFPSGAFDAIQSTGSLAAGTAMAYQLGVVDRAVAIDIVTAISNTLLERVPRFHGLWPHWVITSTGVITIASDTEWSSIDTVIAGIALLDAQVALGLDTISTTQMFQGVDWNGLKLPDGVSHGYKYDGSLMATTWDTFGGESWLVDLAYASAQGEVPPLKYPLPPTANGSGFIDELAWLFVLPPSRMDVWGADWSAYRSTAALTQTTYYTLPSCFTQLGLFGLSAGEVPDPSVVTPTEKIYQPFGVGGQFSPPNDGVVVPHYAAMMASVSPVDAITMWTWLINKGHFSPLNNVESLLFPKGSSCDAGDVMWNQLKGSWNLALQTLGWGRYLEERQGQMPILWRATFRNEFLRDGYLLLVPGGLSDVYLPVIMRE